MAEPALLRGKPRGRNDEAFEARRTYVQAAFRECHRPGADRLRPAPAHRRREGAPGAQRRTRGRDQLARRLRGSGLLSAALQADDGPGAGGVSEAFPHCRLRSTAEARPALGVSTVAPARAATMVVRATA